MNNQFLGTFLNEWDLYQKQGGTPTVDNGRSGKGPGDFDRPVRAGEIRVFADSDRQLIGLVYKSWGEDAWIIIPVSEFSVPATEQEILIGSRVYQLWNAFTASTAFAGKSWLIDTLALDDQQDVSAALLHMTIGEPLREDLAGCLGEKITSTEDPRLEYERTFVVSAGFLVDADRRGTYYLPSPKRPAMKGIGGEKRRGSDRVICIAWRVERRNACWEKYHFSEPRYALAAATDDLFAKVPVLLYNNAWDAMLDGQLVSQFSGYRVGDDKRWISFALVEPLPPIFDGTDIFAVNAYRRTTREIVGSGKLKRMPDGSSRISVQFDANVSDASEIVLVVEERDSEVH